MKLSLASVANRTRARAAFGASLLLLAGLTAALPAGTLAEQASQPLEPAAAHLDVGKNMSCALVTDGAVRCWGFSLEGGLGYGNTQTIGDDETPGSAGPVNLGAGQTASAISVGDGHACALLEDASVRCWGFSGNGRLGYPLTGDIGDNEAPGSAGPVSLGGQAKAITAGGSHSCALLVNDTMRCWGYGSFGALGYGGGDPNQMDSNLAPPHIGDNELPSQAGPVSFGPDRKPTAISAGGSHTCAILDDGSVRCWGYGGNGQLGNGSSVNHADPSVLGPVPLGGQKAVAISAGDLHTCVVVEGGSVRCWGEGLYGRLGNGDQQRIGDNPGELPVTVELGGPAVAISAGSDHTCARLTDSTVRCWGLGASGQLGYGNRNSVGDDPGELPATTVGPVNLGAGRSALAISAGGRHTCARLEDGVGVSCWGYGGNGRLGYCNERSVGDDEAPGAAGLVPLNVAVRAPDATYPGCARAAAGGGPGPAAPSVPAGDNGAAAALAAEALRRRAFRSCLARASRHARVEIRRARRASGGARARLRRHIRRHRSQKRRACVRRHGRTPGRVEGLTARAASRVSVVLSFRAAGTDGNRPPAARTYVVKQSRRPIRTSRAFRRAQTLCRGRCRFPAASDVVGGSRSLTVEDLSPRTTYYYAVAARDNVSGRLGPRSAPVRVRTR